MAVDSEEFTQLGDKEAVMTATIQRADAEQIPHERA